MDLSLRIGLNSGPTTAGVLRGEKARFQLFGDVRETSKLSGSKAFPLSHSIVFVFMIIVDCKYRVSDGEQWGK
jgi:hypothetical protein